MRTQLITAAVVALLSVADAVAQVRQAPRSDDEGATRAAAGFDTALVGTWKSTPETMKLTSDFDKSVWGADASSVRSVELDVQSSGDATLKVIKKVVDSRGRTLDASTWVEEVRLKLGESKDGIATRVEHEAAVVSAVRLFPDDPNYKWAIEGLRVQVVTFRDDGGKAMEVRYDTPEGRGSFWETLQRARPAQASRRAAR